MNGEPNTLRSQVGELDVGSRQGQSQPFVRHRYPGQAQALRQRVGADPDLMSVQSHIGQDGAAEDRVVGAELGAADRDRRDVQEQSAVIGDRRHDRQGRGEPQHAGRGGDGPRLLVGADGAGLHGHVRRVGGRGRHHGRHLVPPHRRRGVDAARREGVRQASDGRMRGLFRECLTFASKHCSEIRVDTHEDNAPMRQLLVAEGFVPCGTVYIADGSPRIAYQKSLEG